MFISGDVLVVINFVTESSTPISNKVNISVHGALTVIKLLEGCRQLTSVVFVSRNRYLLGRILRSRAGDFRHWFMC